MSPTIEDGKNSASVGPINRGRLSHNILFLRKFFRHGVKIASVWPSSRFMALATLNKISWSTAKVIVELGAGTGPITAQIIERLSSKTQLFVIEFDADFVKILQERFQGHANVRIIQGDVGTLGAILAGNGIGPYEVDYFVSGLATPTLPEPVRHGMFAAVKEYLNPQGFFSNITEIPWYYLRRYRQWFGDVSFELVPLNMPPGGVYHCRSIR